MGGLDITQKHKWQCRELTLIESLSYVIANLLNEDFVVEIKGQKYDLSFFKNNKTDEIGYSWSSSPSPHLTSYKIIEEAFRDGVWYKVKI